MELAIAKSAGFHYIRAIRDLPALLARWGFPKITHNPD
jgi:hypothetical protein